jgi:hypothetical protein
MARIKFVIGERNREFNSASKSYTSVFFFFFLCLLSFNSVVLSEEGLQAQQKQAVLKVI